MLSALLVVFSLLTHSSLTAQLDARNQNSLFGDSSSTLSPKIEGVDKFEVSRGCKRPVQGPVGPSGPAGPGGSEGPIGPTGPAGGGASSPAYASYYALQGESEITVDSQDPILLTTANVPSNGISYNDTTGVFTILQDGIYLINFGAVSDSFGGLFALRVNGIVLPGTNMSSVPSSVLASGSVIVSLDTGDTLELINNKGNLIYLDVGTIGGVVAYISIDKISD